MLISAPAGDVLPVSPCWFRKEEIFDFSATVRRASARIYCRTSLPHAPAARTWGRWAARRGVQELPRRTGRTSHRAGRAHRMQGKMSRMTVSNLETGRVQASRNTARCGTPADISPGGRRPQKGWPPHSPTTTSHAISCSICGIVWASANVSLYPSGKVTVVCAGVVSMSSRGPNQYCAATVSYTHLTLPTN